MRWAHVLELRLLGFIGYKLGRLYPSLKHSRISLADKMAISYAETREKISEPIVSRVHEIFQLWELLTEIHTLKQPASSHEILEDGVIGLMVPILDQKNIFRTCAGWRKLAMSRENRQGPFLPYYVKLKVGVPPVGIITKASNSIRFLVGGFVFLAEYLSHFLHPSSSSSIARAVLLTCREIT